MRREAAAHEFREVGGVDLGHDRVAEHEPGEALGDGFERRLRRGGGVAVARLREPVQSGGEVVAKGAAQGVAAREQGVVRRAVNQRHDIAGHRAARPGEQRHPAAQQGLAAPRAAEERRGAGLAFRRSGFRLVAQAQAVQAVADRGDVEHVAEMAGEAHPARLAREREGGGVVEHDPVLGGADEHPFLERLEDRGEPVLLPARIRRSRPGRRLRLATGPVKRIGQRRAFAGERAEPAGIFRGGGFGACFAVRGLADVAEPGRELPRRAHDPPEMDEPEAEPRGERARRRAERREPAGIGRERGRGGEGKSGGCGHGADEERRSAVRRRPVLPVSRFHPPRRM